MAYHVGVDIGGSFTDFAVFDDTTRSLHSLKVFSRPDQPGAEVMEGIRLLAERQGIDPAEIVTFTHGTTVGVNTVVQRKGLKLALFVTEHFRDVLEIGRLKTADMYSLLAKRPEPLIPRDMVFGIAGRLLADGTVDELLDEAGVEAAVVAARSAGAEGIVIAFLHAYRNGEQEEAARAIVSRLAPDLPVFTSSSTWPIIREYERTVTAVIGGYVQPRVAHYLGSLQEALKDQGVPAEALITKSNGGVMTAEKGKTDCVQMILSGTASGVTGACHIARLANVKRAMTLDIGGTTADVALLENAEPFYGVGERIGDYQIFIPTVSVTSIGDGGGSLAWVDPLGVLKVGPESAGSTPGPAAFGRGGTRATITDAFVANGLVGHSGLGYDAVRADRGKARDAVADLAGKIGKNIEQTAEAIIDIAVSGMFTEVSGLMSRAGADPRDHSIIAFGGAGPMLAVFLARELGMPEVVVPQTPGVLSALGGLIADLKNDFIETLYLDVKPQNAEAIRAGFVRLAASAEDWLTREQGFTGSRTLIYSAEMRYQGQSFELDSPFDPAVLETGDTDVLAEAFHTAHEALYGHANRAAPVQLITARVVVRGETDKPDFPAAELRPVRAEPETMVPVWLDGATVDAAIHRRAALSPGASFDGPAVVLQDDCTTVVPAGFTVAVDAYHNLRITRGAAA
ncbi:hydantoinase/oxoprolinase family protein [Acuticoccus sediminis]|uniref:hydantoinase/oxoprolinase family protein n=1 Tax=Acuticoccus sediminis TaxID=2184697 RepID=UPI001CFECCE6|nr:hydantoinase/oxoprolinase family protein [Acuticoccus sediminis]